MLMVAQTPSPRDGGAFGWRWRFAACAWCCWDVFFAVVRHAGSRDLETPWQKPNKLDPYWRLEDLEAGAARCRTKV